MAIDNMIYTEQQYGGLYKVAITLGKNNVKQPN
jgi:hypothetical protein